MRSSSGIPKFLVRARTADIAPQILEAIVADGDAEILPGDVLDLVRFVEHHGVILRQDAACELFVLQRQVGEEQVVIDDDDVALRRPLVHLA